MILIKINFEKATLCADDFIVYKPFSKIMNKATVNHSKRQYVYGKVDTVTPLRDFGVV